MCAATKPNNISNQEEDSRLKQRGNKTDTADNDHAPPRQGEPLDEAHGALANSENGNHKEERKKSVTFSDTTAPSVLEKKPIQQQPTPFEYETPETPTEFSCTKFVLNKTGHSAGTQDIVWK